MFKKLGLSLLIVAGLFGLREAVWQIEFRTASDSRNGQPMHSRNCDRCGEAMAVFNTLDGWIYYCRRCDGEREIAVDLVPITDTQPESLPVGVDGDPIQ